ncbi:MAG: hypothetical protein AAB209_08860 [Bacteroidota bacterium]
MKRSLLILLLLLTAIVGSTEKRNDTNHPDSRNVISLEVLQDLRAGDDQQQVGMISDLKKTPIEVLMQDMEEQIQQIVSLFTEQKEASNLATH